MDSAYSVEVIGFNATERIVLGSIFNLSARRTPRYEHHQGGIQSQPHIMLVDAADPKFIEQAKMLLATRPTPVVLVGDRDFGTGWPVVGRPLQWARLFRAFDLAVGAIAGGAATDAAARPSDTEAMRTFLPSMGSSVSDAKPLATQSGATNSTGRAMTVARPIAGAPWVLVVDDSAPVREFMREVLAPLAFNIDMADSGEKAIGMTAGRDYACIFLDVMLPGVDGYQVCKLIKSKPTGKRTPVIMLTSKSSPFDRIRGTMAGCDSYLTKPVEEEKLRTVVTKILQAHGHGVPVASKV
jgi:two-component system, cell cycle response regulator